MRAALLALLLFVAGCPTGLEEQQHISKLRVLAVRAEPAELILRADGGLPATTLTALAVDVADAGITVRFALCTDLSGVPSANLPCPGSAGIDLPEAGPSSAQLDLSDPRILAFAASVQLDGGAFDAGGIAETLDQGLALLVGFTAVAQAQSLSGFATITLRTEARGPVNLNPRLIGLDLDGGPADGGPIDAGETVRLQPVTEAKDPASKKYGFSFFATAGSISSLRSTDTTATGQAAPTWVDWTAPAATSEVRLWVVVRDGRGGTDFFERVVQVK